MKFEVSRTSDGLDKSKLPCEEAAHEIGADREIDWFVEIGSLEALMAFVEKHGRIVLSVASTGETGPIEDNTRPAIEIYDDWRE